MPIPTLLGDVLILQTEKGVKMHAVGRVTTNGQQDFHHTHPTPIYLVDHHELVGHHEALALARTLVWPGGRLYLVKVDSDEWFEVSS